MKGKQFSYWKRLTPFEPPICYVCKHSYIKNTNVLPRRCMCCNSYMVTKKEYEEFVDMAGGQQKTLYCTLDYMCKMQPQYQDTHFTICCYCCHKHDKCSNKCLNHPDRCNCYTFDKKLNSETDSRAERKKK